MKNFKIAIVGAGPAGYFAAQALQNLATDELSFSIDMIERLPTPWGLVRSGVAPDHPKIKSVSKVFEKIANTPGFRLFANVELGIDLTIEQLRERYDAVVLATGSPKGKKLGIPGEGLPGSLSAATFVPWYNAHPDFKDENFDLSSHRAVVIGAGNVAMDVARMLALQPSELDPTDTADHAIDALRESAIREVVISARRGAEHAAFTSPELRELPKLEHTNVVIEPEDISAAIVRAGDEIEKDTKSNLDAMTVIAEREPTSHERTMRFQFMATPIEIKGNGKVEEVVFKGTGGDETFSIKCGLVITAIGYESPELDGIPFAYGKVVNNEGHVDGNLYVVGWAKRGPSGVIGTNKSDAADVMKLLVSQLGSPKDSGDLTEVITHDKVVTQMHWEQINAAEIAAGEPLGKPRKKAVSREELLNLGAL
ncbi:GltD NADPH-dependent glutamate synthase beta chain and related oxidoreductases [Candidatus Nanopelagicaceae bacterium]